jgi:hypothetical protein
VVDGAGSWGGRNGSRIGGALHIRIFLLRGLWASPMLNPSLQLASPNSKARYKTASVVYSPRWVASLIVSSSFIE